VWYGQCLLVFSFVVRHLGVAACDLSLHIHTYPYISIHPNKYVG
jgi:hypothetical protein